MNKVRLSVAAALAFSPLYVSAASYGVEARGAAMGGTGVVAATYLTAPFYNPALTAIYRRNDDAGMLLPSVGVVYDDSDGMYDGIERLASAISAADAVATQDAIDALNGDELKLELGAAAAFGIPNPYLSMTIFGKTYGESYITPNINTSGPLDQNYAEAASVVVMEAGVSIARYSTVLGQHMSFGFSPKLQRIESYAYSTTLQSLGTDSTTKIFDLFENKNAESMFNLDAGALWFYGPARIGFSATNLFSRKIESKAITTTDSETKTFVYEVQPQYTVGAGLVFDYLSISADYDLNTDSRFTGFADDTQWLRAGVEVDLLRQLQVRAGFKKNLAYDDSENTYTAGLGISPLGLFELDVSVSYTAPRIKAGYVNFLATY